MDLLPLHNFVTFRVDHLKIMLHQVPLPIVSTFTRHGRIVLHVPWPRQRRLSVGKGAGTQWQRKLFHDCNFCPKSTEFHSWQQKLFVIFHGRIIRFIFEKNSGQTTTTSVLSDENSVPCSQLALHPKPSHCVAFPWK